MIEVPPDRLDSVYRQTREFVDDLEEKTLSKKIRYKEIPPSARHRGLTPLMVSLLSIIHKAYRIAGKLQKDFYGLTLYECQKAVKSCNISNHTVRDNLKKLVRLRLLQKNVVVSKSTKHTCYNLQEPEECINGAWVIWNKDSYSPEEVYFVLNCPSYPHCSMEKRDCMMVHHLNKLQRILPSYIDTVNNNGKSVKPTFPSRLHVSKSVPIEEKLNKVIEVPDEIKSAKTFRETDAKLKKTVRKRILELRQADPPIKYLDCIIIIKKEFNVDINRHDVYIASSTYNSVYIEQTEPQIVNRYCDINEKKKLTINKKVLELRKNKITYDECIEQIKKNYNVILTRHDVYSASKDP